MVHIRFRYRNKMSNWEWRYQECTISSVAECIKRYGLESCEYEIISVDKIMAQSFSNKQLTNFFSSFCV